MPGLPSQPGKMGQYNCKPLLSNVNRGLRWENIPDWRSTLVNFFHPEIYFKLHLLTHFGQAPFALSVVQLTSFNHPDFGWALGNPATCSILLQLSAAKIVKIKFSIPQQNLMDGHI